MICRNIIYEAIAKVSPYWLVYNYSTNLGPTTNDASQKSESSSNTMSGTQPSSKPTQNSSHSPANDPGNSVPINQSGVPPSTKGDYIL